MIHLLYLYADTIVSDLEAALSAIKWQEFKIKYTDSKGKTSPGTLTWDKTNPWMYCFVIKVNGQITTIVNDQKKIIMKVEREGVTGEAVKPKDISDNPLSAIFKERVQFVEHSDSYVQATSKDLGDGIYQVVLHQFNDPHHEKDRIVLEYAKTKMGVVLRQWITIIDKKKTTIEFRYTQFR